MAGLVLTLLVPTRWRRPYALLAVGVALAAAFLLIAYLSAPPDYQHSQGDSDGRMFWGRWWEPEFTLFLIAMSYLCWAGGVGVGLLSHMARRGREREPT